MGGPVGRSGGLKRWLSDVQKQTRHGRWRTGAETETEMGSESLMVVFSLFFPLKIEGRKFVK